MIAGFDTPPKRKSHGTFPMAFSFSVRVMGGFPLPTAREFYKKSACGQTFSACRHQPNLEQLSRPARIFTVHSVSFH